jgi:hypothetical protein
MKHDDHFTKTGSGHTRGNISTAQLKKRGCAWFAFLCFFLGAEGSVQPESVQVLIKEFHGVTQRTKLREGRGDDAGTLSSRWNSAAVCIPGSTEHAEAGKKGAQVLLPFFSFYHGR